MSLTAVDINNAPGKSSDRQATATLPPVTRLSIIDDELNRHGMGRYHWLIWAICGLGYLLDAIWGQAIGLVSPNIQREFGFSDKEFGNINAAYSAGMIAGAFVWGTLVDVAGRRIAFYGTPLFAGVFGMCLGAMSSYQGLLVIVALIGFGAGGSVPIDSTIAAEYLPENRFYFLTALAIFIPLGFVMCTLTGFWLIPHYSCSTSLVSCHLTGGVEPCCSKNANMGWRYLFFSNAFISLGIFIIRFFIFPFYESPKFLISKGDDRGAVEIVQKVVAFNKHSSDLTMESLNERCEVIPVTGETGFYKRVTSEISRLRLLFASRRITRVTILVWVTWIFDMWGISIISTYLPTILQRKNSAIHVTLQQTYIDYLIIFIPGIPATILSVLMVRAPLIGRKWTLVFSSMMVGISLFLYNLANTQASHVGFNVMVFSFGFIFNSVLFGWTPEAFPTAVRGTAVGMANVFGSLFGVSGPLMAAQLFARPNGGNTVLYLAGSGFFICLLAILCIPTKSMVVPR